MRRCFITGARSSSVSTAVTPGTARAALGIDSHGSRRADADCARKRRRARLAGDVVDKTAAAGQQRMIFKAVNARSDQFAQDPSLKICPVMTDAAAGEQSGKL